MLALQEKRDTHATEAGTRTIRIYRDPACGTLVDGLVVDAEHAGDGGPGEIDIEEADAGVGIEVAEGEGELHGYGALSDAALAGEDEEDVLDVDADEEVVVAAPPPR